MSVIGAFTGLNPALFPKVTKAICLVSTLLNSQTDRIFDTIKGVSLPSRVFSSKVMTMKKIFRNFSSQYRACRKVEDPSHELNKTNDNSNQIN